METKPRLFQSRKLNRRETIVVSFGALVIFCFLLIQFIVLPMVHKKTMMDKKLLSRQTSLKEMLELKAEYDALKKSVEISDRRFAQREKGFTLFSFLDRLAGEVGIKENISYMKPSVSEKPGSNYKKSLVEMKIKDISMEQLTTFLYDIETSREMVMVRRLSISKKSRVEGLITVVVQVETLES